MKWPVASSKTRRRLIFLLKSKSKFSSERCGSRNCACLVRRSTSRVARRESSSETSAPMKSIGAMLSACACRMRVSTTSAIPPSRSWLRDLVNSMRFISMLLRDAIDEIAVLGELSDERVDLTKRERRRRLTLQIATHETVRRHTEAERCGACVVDRSSAVLARECEHSLNSADAFL